MISSKALVWRLGIASTALVAAIAVYCLARTYPPELIAPFQTSHPIFTDQIGLFGSAPSFLYTLAIGLIIGSCASTQASAKIHCLTWIGLVLLLEITQHPAITEPLASWLAGTLNASAWELVGPYWSRGAFDPLDLIATVMGGLIAFTLITYLPVRFKDAQN